MELEVEPATQQAGDREIEKFVATIQRIQAETGRAPSMQTAVGTYASEEMHRTTRRTAVKYLFTLSGALKRRFNVRITRFVKKVVKGIRRAARPDPIRQAVPLRSRQVPQVVRVVSRQSEALAVAVIVQRVTAGRWCDVCALKQKDIYPVETRLGLRWSVDLFNTKMRVADATGRKGRLYNFGAYDQKLARFLETFGAEDCLFPAEGGALARVLRRLPCGVRGRHFTKHSARRGAMGAGVAGAGIAAMAQHAGCSEANVHHYVNIPLRPRTRHPPRTLSLL